MVNKDDLAKQKQEILETVDAKLKVFQATNLENTIQVQINLEHAMLKRDIYSYGCSIRVTGYEYNRRDFEGDEEKIKKTRAKILKAVFVDTGVVPEADYFFTEAPLAGQLKDVLSDLHPLGPGLNAPLVFKFTKQTSAKFIKNRVQSNNKALQGKLGTIKIHPHYPPPIEALKNATVKRRKELIDENKNNKDNKDVRFVCRPLDYPPYTELVRITGEKANQTRTALPVEVEDGRLADLARSLALIRLNKINGGEFIPLEQLRPEQAAEIQPGTVPAAVLKRKRGARDDAMQH